MKKTFFLLTTLGFLTYILATTGCCEIEVEPCSSFISCDGFEECGPNSQRFSYGEDPRQVLELIKPENVSDAPVIIYIHGGGWMSGPKADVFFSDINSHSLLNLIPIGQIRRRMVDEKNFAFVHLKYRLLEGREAGFESNASYVDNVLDDVQSAIDYLISNSDCLGISSNEFVILGDSAGGHIALMYAYTRSNPEILKAVGAMYAPTDLQIFGDFLSQKSCFDSATDTPCSYDKYAYFFDTTSENNQLEVNWAGGNVSGCNKTDSYNIIQSVAGQSITDPLNSNRLRDISPKYALNSTRNIPTFIQHGNDDRLVPYIQAQQSMETELNSFGGVETASNPCPNCKHKIALYDYFDHGWTTPVFNSTTNFYDLDAIGPSDCPSPTFNNTGNMEPIQRNFVDWVMTKM